MGFFDLAQKRYSSRKYSDRPVSGDQLEMVLEAGRLAPTAANRYPVRVFVVKSEENLDKIRSLTKNVFDAPVVILVAHDKDQDWKATNFNDDFEAGTMDASIATTFMMMEATDLGMGTLWARGFNGAEIAKAFDMPNNYVLDDILILGYPAEDDEPSPMHSKVIEFNDFITEI